MIAPALLVQAAHAAAAVDTEMSSTSRIVQFAAILLELGGVVLVLTLFAIVRRTSRQRDYFSTWTYAWFAMAVGIAAITARYVLLSDVRANALPDDAPAVRALYLIYETGKLLYWTLVGRGALQCTGVPVARAATWVGGTVAYAIVAFLLSADLNNLLVWQAPVAVAACALGARALLRVPRARRSIGSVATAFVLTATALAWVTYFAVFGDSIRLFSLPLGPLRDAVLNYDSYADVLLVVALGYAMLTMFMEASTRRLSDIEARVASLVRTAPEPIIALDDDQRVIVANEAAIRLFGAGERVSPGSSVADFVAAVDRARLRTAIDAFAAGDDASRLVGDDGCVLATRADGIGFAAEFTLSRLFDVDVRGVSLVVRDVTVRREEEQRRRQESTMEAVRQLAGGLAHDFNNLLTTIVGRSQIVARTLPASSPVREDALQIEQAAAAAARLSRGLLALSRREPLDPARLSVDDVVRASDGAIRRLVAPGVACTVRLGSGDAPAHVDRARLEGALLAIVQNASEAVGATGTIAIETLRAHLPHQFGEATEAACITVRDSGSGLVPDARTHLFEPFFSTKGDGRGLGLATTWAFVHQSGGAVDIESGTQGSTVRLLFPIACDETAEVPVPALAIVGERPRPRRTVLVAEDEPSVRRSVRIFLERAGFTVVEAADGVEALAAFERAPDEFGLLLSDVMMPQMGGGELAARALKTRPDLRVVFMSGFLRDPDVLRMVNDRRVRYLAKPFDVDVLVSTVRGELEQQGTNAA